MKLAVDAGEMGAMWLPVTGGGDNRLKRLVWLSLDVALAAVFRRMASWRLMEGFAGGWITGGAGEMMGGSELDVWVFGCSLAGFEGMVTVCFTEESRVL